MVIPGPAANGPTVVLKRLWSAGCVTADVEDGIDVETEGFDCGRCSIFDVVICRQIALEMASNG